MVARATTALLKLAASRGANSPWTQSATSLHSLVGWSSPSKVTEPRHVLSGNRRRLVAESFPVTARAAAVRASERCWSLTLAFAQGWLQPRLHPPPASRTLSV